jgi:hypothetical protein
MTLIQERDKLIPISQVSVKNLKLFEDEEVYPKNVKKLRSYLTENKLRRHYNSQSVEFI